MDRILTIVGSGMSDEVWELTKYVGLPESDGLPLLAELSNGEFLLLRLPLRVRSVAPDPENPSHAQRQVFDLPVDVDMVIDIDHSPEGGGRLACRELVLSGTVKQAALGKFPLALLVDESVKLAAQRLIRTIDDKPFAADQEWHELGDFPNGMLIYKDQRVGDTLLGGLEGHEEVTQADARRVTRTRAPTRGAGRPPAIPDLMLRDVATAFTSADPKRPVAEVQQYLARKLGRRVSRSSVQRAIDRAAAEGYIKGRSRPATKRGAP